MQAELRARISLKNPLHFLALGFGSGLAPFMPGTFGTLAALPLVWLGLQADSLWLYAFVCLLASVVGVYICGKTSSDMQVHDHGAIVWDEVAGMLITMLAIPFSWGNLLVGFVLFRLFDIAKPWPINALDKKVHGGLGIMLDDILAGLVSCLLLHLLLQQAWWPF